MNPYTADRRKTVVTGYTSSNLLYMISNKHFALYTKVRILIMCLDFQGSDLWLITAGMDLASQQT